MADSTSITDADLAPLRESMARGRRRLAVLCGVLALIVCGLVAAVLTIGNTLYSPALVWSVLTGAQVEDATYAIWEVR
ncbi:MAG: hypothetical protein KHY83_11765, partial [Coriobacteriia bacterium]|nr:hypothetical protein [Coriobacteriia bacterium]